MKYFLYELIVALNKDDTPHHECEAIEAQLQFNHLEYNKQFNMISHRLPVGVSKRLNLFHDYILTKLDIKHTSLLNTAIHFTLSNGEQHYCLSFNHVAYYCYKHHNFDNKQPVFSRDVDSWLNYELLPINEQRLSFEILFASGANLYIEFNDKNIAVQKII